MQLLAGDYLSLKLISLLNRKYMLLNTGCVLLTVLPHISFSRLNPTGWKYTSAVKLSLLVQFSFIILQEKCLSFPAAFQNMPTNLCISVFVLLQI